MKTENNKIVNSKIKNRKSVLLVFMVAVCFLALILLSNSSFSILNIRTINFSETCIPPWDIGNVPTKYTVVRPIGDVCYQRCKSECEGLANKINYENLSEFNEAILESNPDIINKCQTACRAGRPFSSPMRIPISDPNERGMVFEWSDVLYADASVYKSQDRSPSIGQVCSADPGSQDAAANNLYDSGFRLKPGVTFKVSLVGGSAQDAENKIVMCGDEVERIDPIFIGYTNNSWNSNSGLWSNRNSAKGALNARNYLFTDTEIDVINGDELTLTYWGQYQFGPKFACRPNGCFSPFIKLRDPRRQFADSNNASNSGTFVPPEAFRFSIPEVDPDNGIPTVASTNRAADDASHNRTIQIFGLTPTTGKIPNTAFNYSVPASQQFYDIENYTIDKQNLYVSYSGVLAGYSSTFTRLGVAHADANTPNTWNDNVGGFSFIIQRKGCVFKQGEQLQWGLLKKQNSTSESEARYETVPTEWNDISLETLTRKDPIPVAFSCSGLSPGVICEAKLVYRIKPLEFDNSKTDTCTFGDIVCNSTRERVQRLYSIENRSGQYNVLTVPPQSSPAGATISSLVSQSDISSESVFTTIVRKIRNHLFFGEVSNNPNVIEGKGIVQVIFENLVKSDFANAIRALVVLYIAYTGLSFMIGISPINQQDAAGRLIKLGIVLTLTAPNAWTFFYTNFFALFVDGGLQLMVLVAGGLDQSADSAQQAAMSRDPTLFFTFFDYPVRILFGHSSMIKVAAIGMSSLMGVFLALVIIFAGAVYALCLFKAVIIYLISLIGIGILLILSPIFISFMLFKYTSEMFKGWWTQLAILVAQPVFVIVGITIFNILLLMGLRVVLGFTVCFGCFLGFTLPFMSRVCIIPGAFPMYNLHLPDDVAGGGLPPTQFLAALFFLLMAQGVYYFVQFASSLSNIIVGGAFAGVDLSKGYDTFDPKQKIYDAFKYATGTDKKAVDSYNQYVGYKKAVRDTGVKISQIPGNAKDKYKKGVKGLDNLTQKLKNYARNTGEDNN